MFYLINIYQVGKPPDLLDSSMNPFEHALGENRPMSVCQYLGDF